MRELSLFTGAGGGILGSKLLGWETIGYVEINDYCQRLIAQRIKDGILDEAPIFGDIKAFLNEGYARSYQGMVDVLTAGFPCQPFSIAGERGGENDARNMWPETIGVIRAVRPRFCLLENVPGLLVHPYFGTILRDISESGFCGEWTCLGAGAIGLNTLRRRVWIVLRNNKEISCGNKKEKTIKRIRSEIKIRRANSRRGICDIKKNWPTAERWPFGVANGMAWNVDRVKAIGNGQVPIVVKTVWELMS